MNLGLNFSKSLFLAVSSTPEMPSWSEESELVKLRSKKSEGPSTWDLMSLHLVFLAESVHVPEEGSDVAGFAESAVLLRPAGRSAEFCSVFEEDDDGGVVGVLHILSLSPRVFSLCVELVEDDFSGRG